MLKSNGNSCSTRCVLPPLNWQESSLIGIKRQVLEGASLKIQHVEMCSWIQLSNIFFYDYHLTVGFFGILSDLSQISVSNPAEGALGMWHLQFNTQFYSDPYLKDDDIRKSSALPFQKLFCLLIISAASELRLIPSCPQWQSHMEKVTCAC